MSDMERSGDGTGVGVSSGKADGLAAALVPLTEVDELVVALFSEIVAASRTSPALNLCIKL
ncbi:MAG: hypothetical protein PsegKO_34720 [Pseudohongiellaceae bacterium]